MSISIINKSLATILLIIVLIQNSINFALSAGPGGAPGGAGAPAPAAAGIVADPTCNGGNGIDTAIGCIPIDDSTTFTGWILGWSIGIGGGVSFLLITYASFLIMTSQGDPTRLKAGQELLTAALTGLMMLIFSVFILKFIGIDILKLDTL